MKPAEKRNFAGASIQTAPVFYDEMNTCCHRLGLFARLPLIYQLLSPGTIVLECLDISVTTDLIPR